MSDDLLPTTAVAALCGRTVATINRWVIEGRITPAVEMPGRTGARLYRRRDIEALLSANGDDGAAA